MTKGFVHINGQTYELAYPGTDNLIESTQNQLKPSGPQASPTVTLSILIGKTRTELAVRPELVWASAAWLAPDPPA